MKVTDLIFFVFSKRYSDEKGSIFDAVAFGFSIPVIFATYLATHFVCGILNTEEKNVPFILELELFISVLILALIFFYYKRGGKGTRIIDHYEKTKYNNWYYLFIIRMALILLFAVLFLFVNELADNFLYSYLMLWKRLYQSPKIAFRGRDAILRVRTK